MRCRRCGYGIAAMVATATLVVGACSTSTTEGSESVTSSGGASAPSSVASDQAKHNDADVAFAQGMIPHHQQATEMSDILLGKQGIDPQIVSLANQIKNAQGPEIKQMEGWLRDWNVAPTPSAPTTTGMPGNMPGHHDGMPGHHDNMPGHHDNMPGHDGHMGDKPGMGAGHGMMSAADMMALQSAQGADAGRLFLTQMIQHHQGAIMMAQHEIHHGQYPATVEMARSIVTTQQDEISTMQEILNG
ncbi:DUF305 domain-containing protein [Mycobacterium lehmannii]|uniref:DUF305 domain-containing protein n=1 Tax=Mycobacterium lehmannii TaxID=2048550 RepID=A0A124EPJ8_9MYCO|nr:DUF305 domain-containing protein [Mycobacterium lehmannii]KUI16078.1 DUF305 domain-containing protein [Mycobacterium lehmannii]